MGWIVEGLLTQQQESMSIKGVNMVELSIIVPVYNVEEFLQECVESLINNDFASKEIILVDDGSTDDSGNICDEYAQKYDYIKVVHKENGGLSSARNCGIEHANGKYLGFVDSDDVVADDMYREMMSCAMLHNADMVVCGIYNFHGDISNKTTGVHSQNTVVYETNEKYRLFIDHNGMGDYAVNKIYLKSLFDTIRFPQGKSFEDIYTSYKIYEKANKVVCLDKDFYYYRYRVDSISRSAKYNPNMVNIVYSVSEQYEFIKKNASEYLDLASQKFLDANMVLLEHLYSNKMIFKEKNITELIRENIRILLNQNCAYTRHYNEAKVFNRGLLYWLLRKKVTLLNTRLGIHPRYQKLFLLIFKNWVIPE